MANTDTVTLKVNPTSVTLQTVTVATGDFGYYIPFVVQDSTGAAFDISTYTVTLHVWLPATPTVFAIEAACTADIAASGTCHYDILTGDLDTAGVYLGKLELTKAGVALSTEQFAIIVTTNASSYVTLADVKDALNITGTGEDDLLAGLIEGVSAEIDNYCRRSFAAVTATRYFDGVADNLVVDDLLTVTTLKLDTDGNGVWETTLTEGTDFLLCPYNENPKWLIRLSPNSTRSDFATGVRKGVEIAGSWGYDTTVPKPVRQAALMQVCREYKLSQAAFGTEIGTPDIGTQTVYQGLSSDTKRKLSDYVRPVHG